jgi:hypothetical protein
MLRESTVDGRQNMVNKLIHRGFAIVNVPESDITSAAAIALNPIMNEAPHHRCEASKSTS